MNIANQIAARAPFRSAQKRAIRNVLKAGAKGCKTSVSGRLGGAEMARTEGYTEGTVPLHTIRADVDYLLITGDANAMLMTLSLNNESDPDVLDKASEYYPARWNEDRLRTLVSMQKLTASDFQSITGKPYETEVIG